MSIVPLCVAARLRQTYANGTHIVLLFDYDGTLVPIVDDPRHARLSTQTRSTLEHLARLARVHVGIISGRGYEDLKETVSIPGLFLAGTSGLELDFRGITISHPKVGAALPLLETVADELHSLVTMFRGAWVESKRLGITLHFRHVVAGQVAELVRLAHSVVLPHAGALRVMEGPLSLEITPKIGWTKGTAVHMFVQSLPAESPYILYAGDGANDIDAFQSVLDRNGLTIGVGANAPSTAKIRIQTTDELCEWLRCLLLSLSEISLRQSQ